MKQHHFCEGKFDDREMLQNKNLGSIEKGKRSCRIPAYEFLES